MNNFHAPRLFTEHPEDRVQRVGGGPIAQAERYWKMFCDGLTLQDIANQVGVTRERVRQVLNRYYPEEYKLQKDENSVGRLVKRLQALDEIKGICAHCKKEFSNAGGRRFCSKECHRDSMRKYEYPEWVNGRSIRRENFTKDEWRQINTLRGRFYYQTHKEEQRKRSREYMKRTKDRQYLYQKRCFERKIYGYAVTPLPGGAKNKAAAKK